MGKLRKKIFPNIVILIFLLNFSTVFTLKFLISILIMNEAF